MILYAAVASSSAFTVASSSHSTAITHSPSDTQPTKVSSLTSDELDQLYERLKHHVEIVDDTQGVSTADMEKIVQESHQLFQQVPQEMKDSVAKLANSIDDLNAVVK
jgi:hypothetical protein